MVSFVRTRTRGFAYHGKVLPKPQGHDPVPPWRPVRLFIAVKVPGASRLQEATAALVRTLPGLRPVPPGSWHITLRFLGEQASAEPALRALEGLPRGPVPILLQGIGAFPTAARARVLWAGAQAPGLDAVAAAVRQATAALAPAERPFVAHVTLGRLDPPLDARKALAPLEAFEGGSGMIGEVVLYRSDPGPAGPAYTALAARPLA